LNANTGNHSRGCIYLLLFLFDAKTDESTVIIANVRTIRDGNFGIEGIGVGLGEGVGL
jgi:hypothetical protein